MAAVLQTVPNSRATGFAQRLLDRESGITVDRLDWYLQHFDVPAFSYWAVHRPGRLRRAADGSPVREPVTVAQFLDRVGVLPLFLDRHGVGLPAVQAAVVNPWGFVGFQFGEALLTTLGYYQPHCDEVPVFGVPRHVPVFYGGLLPNHRWQGGRTQCLMRDPESGQWRIGTDVNRWDGTFTGQDGIHSFSDLCRYDSQVLVLRREFRHHADVLNGHLASESLDLWSAAEAGYPNAASLLAACHLCGPWAVTAYLADRRTAVDETGTALTEYLATFADAVIRPEDIWPSGE